MPSPRVQMETDDGVALLRLARPEKKNALDYEAWVQLLEAMNEARSNDAVRSLVVTGDGGNFCAGTDLGELSAAGDGAATAQGPHPSHGLVELLSKLYKPLIAAVDGVAVGFGLTLLFHCDVVFVTPGARLRAPFVGLGVVPEAASTYLAPGLLGLRNAAELFFASEFVSGERAVELGLANRCVESDQLLTTALERARALAAQPPNALQYTKRLLIEARESSVLRAQHREEVAFAELLGAPESVEAMRAFVEKRAPDYSNLPAGSLPRRDRG